jgi:hypothetical protein
LKIALITNLKEEFLFPTQEIAMGFLGWGIRIPAPSGLQNDEIENNQKDMKLIK